MAEAPSIAAKVAEALSEVASTAPGDLTPELAGVVKSGSQMLAGLCDAGAAAAALATAPPLLSLVATPAPRAAKAAPPVVVDAGEAAAAEAPAEAPPQPVAAWREADLTEDRTAVLTSACAGLSALASHAPGRLALRKHGAVAALLALVQPPTGGQPALQAQATLALSHLAESPMCRASLNEPAVRPSLLALLAILQSRAAPTDALALRLRAKVLLLLGFCLYDGKLLPQLLGASLVEHALALLEPTAAVELDPEAEPPEPPSGEALQCAAELKSNAATVVAIAGQSAAGREAIVAAGGLTTLVKALSPPAAGADGEPPPPAATDQAAAALMANVTLALAHAALSGSAAVFLASQPEIVPLLASILAPSPEGAVPGWSAVRGNACTALLHIVHQPAGRLAFLAAPAALAPGEAAPEGEEEATDPKEEAAGGPATALEAVVAVLLSAIPSADPDAETPAPAETDANLLAAAADILNQCASETDGRAAIMGAGGAPALMALLDAEQPPVLLEPVVAALSALAAHPDACVLLGTSPPAPVPPAEEGDAAADPKSEEAQADEEPPPPPPPAPPPLAVVPALLASDAVALRRAGAGLAAASCIDSGNAAILIKLKVLPLLVRLADTDAVVGAAARMAIDALCLAVPSALLWRTGTLPTSVGTTDGFFAVTRDTELLALEDLALSNKGPEVVAIDASTDTALGECIAAAAGVVSRAGPALAASALARFVADRMGGAVDYEAYELYVAPAAAVEELRAASGTRVVPLGALAVGSARHRAIMFKVLADRAGLKASLEMGKCIHGAHAHHAWNSMILDGKVVVVDLLHAPGECYEEGSDAARRYQRIGEFAFSSLATRQPQVFELAQQTGA